MSNIETGQFFVGVVEDRIDPLKVGRVRVRVVGLHTHDKVALPTSDLPWAMLMQPAAGGTGAPAVGPAEGTTVIVIFNDYPKCQLPIVIGQLAGIPQEKKVFVDNFEDTPLWVDDITPQGRPMPTAPEGVDGNQLVPLVGSNPVFQNLSSLGNRESTSAANAISALLYPPVIDTFSVGGLIDTFSVGGLAGSSFGLGEIYNDTVNAFESLLQRTGNFDEAASKLSEISGEVSEAQRGVLERLNQGISFGGGRIFIPNNPDAFNASTIFDTGEDSYELPDLGLPGGLKCCPVKLPRIPKVPKLPKISAIAYVPPLPKLPSLDDLKSLIGLDDLPCIPCLPGPDTLAQIQDIENFVAGVMKTPERIAEQVEGEFGVYRDAYKRNVGNITRFVEKLPVQVTFDDFSDVEEGSTPPLAGSYGGPNFAGASPVYKIPENPASDTLRYTTGSTKEIATNLPDWWKGDVASAQVSIAALLAAADSLSFTNEQKAAMLAIIAGDDGLVLKEESCQYGSPERLLELYPATFKGDKDLADEYANWLRGGKGDKEDFWNFVLDTCNTGRTLGNIQPGDGEKYVGRGFLQIRGRGAYRRYAKITNYPIDTTPEILDSDINVAAAVACNYFLESIKHVTPTSHPGVFYAARKFVGNNSPDTAAVKLAFYEHFYGTKTPEGFRYTTVVAGNTESPNSYNGSVIGNERGLQDNAGFQDPHKKYPPKRKTGQPEVQRLARGISKETIVALKESQRTLGVPVALNSPPWDQPHVPFAAKYPFNSVRETESGHVQEFDDTPGYERIHTYHRSGTFEEIDADGTVVRKIVGDGYVIYDRNGFVSIAGDANVTVTGNVNVFCQSDANIEVAGSAEMKVGGNFDIGVARDMNIAVEGSFSLWANGAMNLQSKQGANIRSEENMYLTTKKELHVLSIEDMFVESRKTSNILSIEDMFVESRQELNVQSTEDAFIESGASTNIKVGTDLLISSVGVVDVSATGDVNVEAAGDVNTKAANIFSEANTDINVLAGGDTSMTASTLFSIQGNTVAIDPGAGTIELEGGESVAAVGAGSPGAAAEATPPTPTTEALVHGMVPPPEGSPVYPRLTKLIGSAPHQDEQFMYELPSDNKSASAQQIIKRDKTQEGVGNTFTGESSPGTGGGGSIAPVTIIPQILSTDLFTADYKLSKHFTLGMLFDGGFNVRHRLKAQNGLTQQEIVANLASLCENVLEKYLEVLPNGIDGLGTAWFITSGYRMGENGSDHCKGRAVDITLVRQANRKEKNYKLIKELDKLVNYDQLILEYKGKDQNWIHTGFRGDGSTLGGTFGPGVSRRQAFTMVDGDSIGGGFILLG